MLIVWNNYFHILYTLYTCIYESTIFALTFQATPFRLSPWNLQNLWVLYGALNRTVFIFFRYERTYRRLPNIMYGKFSLQFFYASILVWFQLSPWCWIWFGLLFFFYFFANYIFWFVQITPTFTFSCDINYIIVWKCSFFYLY